MKPNIHHRAWRDKRETGRYFWAMLARAVCSVALLAAGLSRLGSGQVAVTAPGGVLRGTIQDSVTGQPVGYALVTASGNGQRVFASESGRFTLGGLEPGRVLLRVTQIGYRGKSIELVVVPPPRDAPDALILQITRQPLVLPELAARSEECPSGVGELASVESGTILDEAFRNAERMLAVQRDYPYRSTFQHVMTVLNAERHAERQTIDTVEYKSRESTGYQAGHVLVMQPTRDFGRESLQEHANYFTASDLARPEFRKTHCFWVSGPDSVRGFPVFRIEFRPLAPVRTPDWSGILQIDSASMHLLRSEAWLVNLPRTGTAFAAARCSALYTQLVPTLVLEFQVHCVSAQNVRPPAFADDRWTLMQRAFEGRRPEP